ncbi:hypothetical protein DFH07DRAFT_934914 [Mycena maculata]|uniref:AB hydrolase-1 domain-containing protein n=1 Tax=Mycena maculata TaxID=230809 RepID=A0AAD7KGI3_9AGAR|nr:hypothetical protein DFH07DRAFT_934914 [Mycena maculata]
MSRGIRRMNQAGFELQDPIYNGQYSDSSVVCLIRGTLCVRELRFNLETTALAIVAMREPAHEDPKMSSPSFPALHKTPKTRAPPSSERDGAMLRLTPTLYAAYPMILTGIGWRRHTVDSVHMVSGIARSESYIPQPLRLPTSIYLYGSSRRRHVAGSAAPNGEDSHSPATDASVPCHYSPQIGVIPSHPPRATGSSASLPGRTGNCQPWQNWQIKMRKSLRIGLFECKYLPRPVGLHFEVPQAKSCSRNWLKTLGNGDLRHCHRSSASFCPTLGSSAGNCQPGRTWLAGWQRSANNTIERGTGIRVGCRAHDASIGASSCAAGAGRIVPREELVWHDCYSDRQCARLKVPLDYSNPDATSAAIAMIRMHSIVPHNSSDYRGPILINPGGPGLSGVDTIQTRGAEISTIVGPEFDVIGFDPRGTSRSTPRVSFFESRSEREVWVRSPDNLYTLSMNASADALPRAWAQGIIEGQLAGARDDGSLRFINTDHTARDMLRIVQAHGREKLQYWGFSYGSILGATFAAMFPDNIERLVIDGVADSENYFATEWTNNINDTEKTWGAFVNGCVAAGPQGCAFFSPTATELEANVDKIYASLRARPIPVRTDTSFGVVDYSMMRSTGNGTALFKMSGRAAFKCSCDPSEFRFETVFDGGIAVRCNDGKRMPGSYEDVLEHYQNMSKLSSWADVWQSVRLACAAWPKFPKNHFQGPFVANTSFPLLLVATTADPVTPLGAAKKMAQGFTGSIVLVQDSAGYFLNGTLPEPGTVCPVIAPPFPSHNDQATADAQAVLARSAGDRKLLEAVTELAKTSDFQFPAGRHPAPFWSEDWEKVLIPDPGLDRVKKVLLTTAERVSHC